MIACHLATFYESLSCKVRQKVAMWPANDFCQISYITLAAHQIQFINLLICLEESSSF